MKPALAAAKPSTWPFIVPFRPTLTAQHPAGPDDAPGPYQPTASRRQATAGLPDHEPTRDRLLQQRASLLR